MARIFGMLAAALGLVAVVMGAWSAHGLTGQLSPKALSSMQTAVLYQFFHALALLLVALGLVLFPGLKRLIAAGYCFLAGTLAFSGSIYALVLLQTRGLGPVTPIGGMILMMGWLMLMLSAWQWGKPASTDER